MKNDTGINVKVKVNATPTPYPDVNQVLLLLLHEARVILGDYFVGMYLYGSLASGDFDPGRSDIDPLVVTRKVLPEKIVSDLKTMHHRIYENGPEWARKLTGAYIPIDAMRKYSTTGPACPLFNRDELLVARPDPDWVLHRHILYNCGVVLTGPTLQTIIDPVTPEDLKKAVLYLLGHNWTPFLNNADWFLGIGYQPFIVLTMCRALYTVKNGAVTSKLRSAGWAVANLDKNWTTLISHAAAWRYGDPPGDIKMTQEFMRYIFKEAGL